MKGAGHLQGRRSHIEDHRLALAQEGSGGPADPLLGLDIALSSHRVRRGIPSRIGSDGAAVHATKSALLLEDFEVALPPQQRLVDPCEVVRARQGFEFSELRAMGAFASMMAFGSEHCPVYPGALLCGSRSSQASLCVPCGDLVFPEAVWLDRRRMPSHVHAYTLSNTNLLSVSVCLVDRGNIFIALEEV